MCGSLSDEQLSQKDKERTFNDKGSVNVNC